MRALFFGRDILEHRISTLMNGIKIDAVKDGILNNSYRGYDLAIVDMSVENAEAACRNITESLDIPLVLIVKDKQIDWQRMDRLNASGFIRDTESTEEMAARISAVTRRMHVPTTNAG
jgi:hypothetical protein